MAHQDPLEEVALLGRQRHGRHGAGGPGTGTAGGGGPGGAAVGTRDGRRGERRGGQARTRRGGGGGSLTHGPAPPALPAGSGPCAQLPRRLAARLTLQNGRRAPPRRRSAAPRTAPLRPHGPGRQRGFPPCFPGDARSGG